MQRFDTNAREGLADEKFPCIVCLSRRDSIEELHNHQKYVHTTEELSLSIIRFVHYTCLKNQALALNLASTCSAVMVPQSHSANYHFRQSHNQTHIISSKDCAININPMPYTSGGLNHKNSSFLGMTRAHEQRNLQAPCSSFIPEKDVALDASFSSSLEIELSRVPEISDETFSKCVSEICRDLEVIERPILFARKQGALKSAKQTNQGAKRNAKRQTHSQTRLLLGLTKMGETEGLQRSQTCAEFPVGYQSVENLYCGYRETMPMNYDRTNNGASTSKETACGSGFGQTF